MSAGCALGLAAAGAATPARAEDAGTPDQILNTIQQQVQSIFHKCRPSVVRIEAVDQHGRLSGSGFFIDPNGMLYTSYTVGGESEDIQVMFGHERYPAERLVSDRRSGVAILKIKAETPFLPFGNSRQLNVASPIVAVGYPMDLPLTPAFGTVGGFDLKYQGRYFATRHLRANVAVQRGEGGAPLLNTKGEAVGILISQLDTGTASFVLPIEAAEKVRRDFLRFQRVRPGWIGVHVNNLIEAVSGSTAVVEGVVAEAPGEKAGIRAGDVLLQVGDYRIASPEDVLNASFFMTAEDELPVRVAREGSEREFNVTPVDHPDLPRPKLPIFGSTGETPVPTLQIDR
jgi:serine protease Do